MSADLERRLAKIEARRAFRPRDRIELEAALDGHMAALQAQHGEAWEEIYRQELQERDPAILAMWDRVVPRLRERKREADALFQAMNGGLKTLSKSFRITGGQAR